MDYCLSPLSLMQQYFSDEGDDDDKKPVPNNDTEHPAGSGSGDYALPDDIGERVGEGENHNPASLGDE